VVLFGKKKGKGKSMMEGIEWEKKERSGRVRLRNTLEKSLERSGRKPLIVHS